MSMYFRSKITQARFKVLSYDRETGIMVLLGEYGKFKEEYTKEKFAKMGYILEKDDDDAK